MKQFLLALVYSCFFFTSFAQSENRMATRSKSKLIRSSRYDFQDIVRTYFKLNPFKIPYSQFLSNFEKDPEIAILHEVSPTDSNYLYISGMYIPQGRFFYLSPDSVKEIITEKMVSYLATDSTEKTDTLAIYQLIVKSANTQRVRASFFKEYNRFTQRYYQVFSYWEEKKENSSDLLKGKSTYYYSPGTFYQVPALTVGVGHDKKHMQYVFTIQVVFKVVANKAIPG
jgi:hypothetical protein